MSPVSKVLWFIESHFATNISLEDKLKARAYGTAAPDSCGRQLYAGERGHVGAGDAGASIS
jgi:hypothetical protein